MSGKLRDYQVLDVLCGGTFYKVRHKVTRNIFAWRAYDCTAYSNEQIQNVTNEVRTISGVQSESLLRFYETILHSPSRTLYFVVEYNCWQSLAQLFEVCKATDKFIAERFAWYLLRELARVCKAVESLNVVVLQKCVTPASIFVGEGCELRVNCFDLGVEAPADLMRQVGDVLHALCYRRNASDDKIKEFHYSDDLQDVVSFLTESREDSLRPDVVLYHPTVLANLETLEGPKHISEILLSVHSAVIVSAVNKCDSEKAVELCKSVEPLPRKIDILDSPIYSNISPKRKTIDQSGSTRNSLSPTLAALALELPGFVPRSRKPYSQALECYKPQKISEDTLSQQWMTRLIALRQREESLNKRERELIAKEIVNSPAAKVVPLNESLENPFDNGSNGITLPPEITQLRQGSQYASRRRRRRSGSVKARRRQTFGYEDLDSSLSADPGDSSMVITATKFTKENMPRRNIFPEVSSKKVHFTSSNPFVESDDSVTLTFYELENVDIDGYQVPRKDEKAMKDITKFKYLDLEKLTTEKRAAMNQNSQCSPSKQAKVTKKIFSDITNTNEGLRKTPSKTSLTSKMSISSGQSVMSGKSQWSMDSGISKGSDSCVADRTRTSTQMSLAPVPPTPAPEVKKSKRKSLLPFKTPFKFMTSTRI
ncbi:hypothetical protein NE865_15299 [Phthorimaea operculella]|nr:hypothetical protein NE865_15299 [Phthorimaea operculella]